MENEHCFLEYNSVYIKKIQVMGVSDTFNKLTSVFHVSVLLLIINFVITLSK